MTNRAVVSRELEEVRSRREGAKALERDRDKLLGSFAGSDAETVGSLEPEKPEERNRVYRMLRLEAHLDADGALSVEGIAGTATLSAVG